MNYPKHLHKDIQEAIILSKDPEHWWFGCSKEMIIEHFVEEEETEKYISRLLAEQAWVEEAERNSGYFRSFGAGWTEEEGGPVDDNQEQGA